MRFLEALADRVTGVTVRTAFGEPIAAGERTVVPVARIGYGFGGGFGSGAAADAARTDADSADGVRSPGGGGFGAGGGVRPYGAIEITEEGTRFVPVREPRRRVLVAALCGFALGTIAGPELARRVRGVQRNR